MKRSKFKNLLVLRRHGKAYCAAASEFAAPYIGARISSEARRKAEEADRAGKQVSKKTALPMFLMIAAIVCAFGAVTLFAIPADMVEEGNVFAVLWREMRWICILCPVLFAAGVALFFYALRRMREVSVSNEMRLYVGAAAKAEQAAKAELGVPEDALTADILGLTCSKGKDGRLRKPGFFSAEAACPVQLFRRGEELCLFAADCLLSVPLHSIEVIRMYNGSARIGTWNKEEPYRSARYKPYKIRSTQNGDLYAKGYAALCIRGKEGETHILFPAYELDAVQSLVHAPVC